MSVFGHLLGFCFEDVLRLLGIFLRQQTLLHLGLSFPALLLVFEHLVDRRRHNNTLKIAARI